MERRKPMKRTAMPRSSKPMKRSEMQRQRTPIKKTSKKRDQENSVRTRVLARLRATRGGCELRVIRGCTGQMDDGHEVKTRGRGGSITDADNILMGCRPCHTFVTDNTGWSDCHGFTVPEWATEQTMDEARLLRELFRRGIEKCSSWCKVHENA